MTTRPVKNYFLKDKEFKHSNKSKKEVLPKQEIVPESVDKEDILKYSTKEELEFLLGKNKE